MRAHLKDNNDLRRLPTVEEVEHDEEPNPLLYKFICWLKNPDKIFELNPESLMLSSLVKSHLTKKKRTTMKTKLSCTIHGLTRCREIIDIIRELGLGISYQDMKNLYATWTYDIKSSCCPIEIAKDFPGTAIMDNDFQDDTLTGAETSDRTNVMFVQPECIANKEASEIDQPILSTHQDLKAIAKERNMIMPYANQT